jgi:hypothetical protein
MVAIGGPFRAVDVRPRTRRPAAPPPRPAPPDEKPRLTAIGGTPVDVR